MVTDREYTDLLALLIRCRRVLTDQPGWDDDEESIDVITSIDITLGGAVPDVGRGAYDEG